MACVPAAEARIRQSVPVDEQDDGFSCGLPAVRAPLYDGCDSTAEIFPVGALPKDPAAPGALEKFSIPLGDEGRDKGNGIIVRERHQNGVAIRTSIVSMIAHAEIDLDLPVELAQLTFKIVADNQRVPAAEKLAKHQASVAREQPPILPERPLD
jgi:hypothetical protein